MADPEVALNTPATFSCKVTGASSEPIVTWMDGSAIEVTSGVTKTSFSGEIIFYYYRYHFKFVLYHGNQNILGGDITGTLVTSALTEDAKFTCNVKSGEYADSPASATTATAWPFCKYSHNSPSISSYPYQRISSRRILSEYQALLCL